MSSSAHVAPALGYAPDRAIRARLRAIVIDGILVGVLSRVLIPAMGIHTFAAAALAALVIQFLYFFLQEGSSGQTIGKRSSGLRVVQLDGSQPTPGQFAIRNALRAFDTLPMFYASGLVSVMWTGPGRRQRLGDRVSGTAVVLGPGAGARTTPDWLLPALTVSAVLLSIVFYGLAYDEYRAPNVGADAMLPPDVPGFAADNSAAPSPGTFTAQAMLNGSPAISALTHQPIVRPWLIEKVCSGATCKYTLRRTVPGLGDEQGDLTQAADGWHVAFPTRAFRVACPGDSSLSTVLRRAAFVIHFEPGGAQAEAHEVTLLHSDRCGQFTQSLDWQATHARF